MEGKRKRDFGAFSLPKRKNGNRIHEKGFGWGEYIKKGIRLGKIMENGP
jgi:hypothetical protein